MQIKFDLSFFFVEKFNVSDGQRTKYLLEQKHQKHQKLNQDI